MTWIHSISSWVPAWLVGAVTIIVPAIVVLVLSRWIIRRLMRLAGRYSPFLQRLFARSQGPASLMLVIVVSGIALAGARFPWEVTAAIGRALAVAFVVALGWAAAIALDIGVEIYLRRFRHRQRGQPARPQARHADADPAAGRENPLGIITAAAALMTFELVRQYGVSLFASAGAAGLVLGLAARPVLSNLLAGIQIAMTQPIRVEDQVVVEGETGWIETITSTYVVVRLWDLRRMVVPLSYFIEKPFQNWTYEGAAQIGAVLLRVGYGVGGPPAPKARGDRPPQPDMGRQGGEIGGYRHDYRHGRVARVGQRAQPRPDLGAALRGAREAGRISAGPAARGCRRRPRVAPPVTAPEYSQSKPADQRTPSPVTSGSATR